VGQALLKRGWKGDGKCCLCGVLETINHLLFECVLAKWIWAVIKEVFYARDIPNSVQEMSEGWLWGNGPLPTRNIMFFFAGFAWTLWVTRNKMAIEKCYPKAPTNILYDALSLLQRWSLLLKVIDKEKVDQANVMLLRWIRNFEPSLVMPTDIVDI
jgi:hypothetical protein